MSHIVVTGAGMGAMSAAARLAVAGHRVTVHERADTFGGGVRRYDRDGYRFDTGPGLLRLPAVYRDLFVKTGREPLEECVHLSPVEPSAQHLFPDGTALTLPATSRGGALRALDDALGEGAGTRWSDLLVRARRTWDVVRRPLLEEPLDPPDAGRQPPLTDPYPALRRRWPRRAAPSLAEVARRELRDPRLVALLESWALEYGFDPRRVPAGAAVLPYLELTFGSWYVAGGMRELARALYERCRARGVEFAFGTEVVRVRAEDGRVAGVELADGTVVPAGVALVPPGLGPDGAGGPLSDAEAAAGTGPGPAPMARFRVLLALRGGRPEGTAHRTVVHSADRAAELASFEGAPNGAPTVSVFRPDDPSLVPGPDGEAVVLTATVPPQGPVDWSAPGVADAFADRMVAAVDAAGLGLADQVRWREVRTPVDWERQTGAPGGVVPGPALAGAGGAYLRAANRGPLGGLYRIGGFCHPGGGLAHAGMGGALAAGLVTSGDDWRGSR